MDSIRVRVKDADKLVQGLNKDTTVRELIGALCMQTKVSGKIFLIKKHGSNETLLHPDQPVWDYYKKKDSKVKFILKIDEAKSEKEKLMPDSIKQSPQRKSLPPKLKKKSKQKINTSKFDKVIQGIITENRNLEHNQNNNNSSSDVHQQSTALNNRTRPSSAMAVSSANNKHSSLNRRTADQTRHLLRQPISSNTSTSSLPVAAQRPSNVQSKGAQEFTSSSSLGNSSSRHRSSSKVRDPANTVDTSRNNRRRREPSESSSIASYSASSLRPSRRSRTPAPGSSSTLSRQQPKRPLSAHGSRKELEAKKKFKQLVEAQQGHLDEYIKTSRTIEKDLNYYVSLWKNKDDLPRDIKSSNFETDILLLEQTISNNDAAIKSEQALLDRLNNDKLEVMKVSEEKQKFQIETDKINRQIEQLKFKEISLNQEILEEKNLKQSKVEATRVEIQNKMDKLKLECDRMKESLDATQQELQLSTKKCDEKKIVLDSLERELRQQKLMKFVHDNGIKRSDLPSSNESKLEDYVTSKPMGILKPPSHDTLEEVVNSVAKKDGDGGFWV